MTYPRKLRCAHENCSVAGCEFFAVVFSADRKQAKESIFAKMREHLLWHANANRGAVLNVARVQHVRGGV